MEGFFHLNRQMFWLIIIFILSFNLNIIIIKHNLFIIIDIIIASLLLKRHLIFLDLIKEYLIIFENFINTKLNIILVTIY